MHLPKSSFAIICLFLIGLSPAWGQEDTSGKSVEAKAVMVSEVPMGWTTQAILSTYVGDDHAEGYIDLLIPLLQGDDGMIFLYPRFGLSSDIDPGYSMGLGARHYIESIDAIIGGNVFYDRYDTASGNYYNQLGLGLEVLTRWVDARFNYYIPDSSPNVIDEQNATSRSVSSSSSWGQPFGTGYTIRQPYTTTTRTTTVNQLFERFEDTMEGFDAEIGVLTPWLEQYVALRWFAGYYDFNNSYGDDLNGVKARAELRFSSKLAVDATYYEDEAVTGDNWLFGFRMTIPVYMENLSQGRSPFEGSFSGMFDGVNLGGRSQGDSGILRGGVGSTYPSRYAAISPFAAMAPAPSYAGATRSSSVRDRMVEEVLRLSGARTSQSDFIENLSKRDVDVDIDEVTRIVVIEDSIVFVSNARGTMTGPGTFENPLNTIQGGVNRASTLFGNRGDVFVAGMGTNYVEDVVDAGSSVKLWGGARGIPVNGGRRFTYGSRPVLDGGFEIDDVPQFTLSGFQIINGFGGSGDGVFTGDVPDVVIEHNDISVGDDAIEMEFDDTQPNTFFVAYNNLHGNGAEAIYVDDVGNSGLTGTIIGNTISDNDTGFEVDLEDEDGEFLFNIFGNSFSGNSEGIWVDASDIDEMDQTATFNIMGNTFNDNDEGILFDYADADNDGEFDVVLTANIVGNTFMSQNSTDIRFDHGSDSSADDATYTFNASIRGNTFMNTGGDSVVFEVSDDYDGDDIVVTWNVDIMGNKFQDISDDAINFSITDGEYDDLIIDVDISGNMIDDVGGDGIYFEISDTDDSDGTINLSINDNMLTDIGDTAIEVIFDDIDGVDTTAFIGGNFINGAGGDGLYFDGYDGTSISSPMGNNLISDVGDDIFDISDVDGQFLINGALEP